LKADVSTGLELALAPDELRARRPGKDDNRNGRTKQARAGRQIGLRLLVHSERPRPLGRNTRFSGDKERRTPRRSGARQEGAAHAVAIALAPRASGVRRK
jgi:hypothetical protein